MEDARGRKVRQDRTKNSAEKSFHGKALRKVEVVKYPVLKELKLTAMEMVKCKALNMKVTTRIGYTRDEMLS